MKASMISAFAGFALVAGLAATSSIAQGPPPGGAPGGGPPSTQIARGTIEKVDGESFVVKDRSGTDMAIKLGDNTLFTVLVRIKLADIKPGSFISIPGMPQPDGSVKAMAISIFPDWIKVPQYSVPYDLQPGSTMTNAVVETTVASVDGQVLTVKYANGEKKVVVDPSTPIFAFERGDKSALKVGAKVFVRAIKQPDGALNAVGFTTTRDGSLPPV